VANKHKDMLPTFPTMDRYNNLFDKKNTNAVIKRPICKYGPLCKVQIKSDWEANDH